MIFFEDGGKEPESKPAPEPSGESKCWLDIGNGKEALVTQPARPSKAEDKPSASAGKFIANKKHAETKEGESIYYLGRWLRVDKVHDGLCTIRSDGKNVDVPFVQCVKEIPIKVLVCNANRTYVYSMLVNGRKTLQQLGAKLAKHNDMHWCGVDWYYNGKKLNSETRIEGVNIKPNEKILCMMMEYEMKTFRRFKRMEETKGWYMNKEKVDAISFVPSQPISLFGFGMYHTREGAPTYLLSYQLAMYDSVVKTDSILVTKAGSEQTIMPIFFSQAKEPILVDAGVRVSIVLMYFDYDDSSRLLNGEDGGDYDSIEGNEPGLFKVEAHAESSNGTNVSVGQVPELYYAKAA